MNLSGLFGLCLLFGLTLAAEVEWDRDSLCDETDDNFLRVNPLGTCICEGHLYVSEDCTEGFYCSKENTQEGCYKVSP